MVTTYAPDASYINEEDTQWYKSDSNSPVSGGQSNIPSEDSTYNYGSSAGQSSVGGGGSSSSSSESRSEGGDSDAAKEAAERAEKKARKTIGGQYDTVRGGLDQLMGYLPGQQQASTDKFGAQRDFTRGQTESALGDAMGRFQGYEGDIMTGQKNTLRDLSSDVRNAFQAGNIYLGAKGASNSSAAGMYSRGIQQAANRNRADVQSQTGTNLSNLNIRREEANTAADRQYSEIDNWFNTSVSDLETQFNDRRQQIEMAKVNATADEQAALAQLDMQLWQSANNTYQQLLAQSDFYSKGVGESISGIGQGTGEATDKIGEGAKGGYEKQTLNDLNGSINTETSTGGPVINPMSKKREDNYDIYGNPMSYGSPVVPGGASTGLGGLQSGMMM